MDQTAGKKVSSVHTERKTKRAAIALDLKVFAAYVGEYELQPGITLTMKQEEGRYYTKLTGQSFAGKSSRSRKRNFSSRWWMRS